MTTAPSIITPQEAQRAIDAGGVFPSNARLAMQTIATEPERIAAAERAAVVKALRSAANRLTAFGHRAAALHLRQDADAIENGAPL